MLRVLFVMGLALFFSQTSLAKKRAYKTPVRTHISLKSVLEADRARRLAPRDVRAEWANEKNEKAGFNIYIGAVQVGYEWNLNIGAFSTPGVHNYLGTCTLGGTETTLLNNTCSGIDLATSACNFDIKIVPASHHASFSSMSCPIMQYDSGTNTWTQVDTLLHVVNWKGYAPKKRPIVLACATGSDISVDNQAISERAPIVGTNFDLVYSSEFAYEFFSLNRQARLPHFRANGLTISIHHAYNSSTNTLYLGEGYTKEASYTIVSGEYEVVSPSGAEVFYFDSNGKHLRTKYALTGATKYTFTYETDDQLKDVTDAFGNTTDFLKDGSGNLSGIRAPRGQVTNINLDSSSLMITDVQNPAGNTYTFWYFSGTEMLEKFEKPGGQITEFSYDEFGKLTEDLGNGGNLWNFVSDPMPAQQNIQKSSALGRVTNYNVEFVGTDYERLQTDPTGLQTSTTEDASGAQIISNGIVAIQESRASDGRLGVNVQRLTSKARLISSNTSTTYYSQSIAGFSGLFNYTSITDSATTSGRTFSSVYTASTKTRVNTSHEGATTTTVINTKEQPASFQVGSDTAWTYSYNAYGKPSVIDQGGYNTQTLTYNANGYVQKITNARNEDTIYTYDNAGRVLTTTLPDLRVITNTYDANGNLLTVTPPSRPVHTFAFNSKELVSSYTPPALLGVTPIATTYTYNNDKQLTSVARPDGRTLAYAYNATTGLLSSITWSGVGNYFTYYANSDQISQIISRDNIKTLYTYYGYKLATEEQKGGTSNYLFSKVTYNYDADHRQTSRVFRGNSATPATTISTTYNNDSKPTLIGNLALTYSYPSGRLSTTTLDNISDSRTYDARGLLQSYTATYTPTSTVLYTYTLTRDVAGRISGKSETVLGVTDTYVYTYDVSGRLTAVTKNGSAYSSYTFDDNGNRTSGVHAGTSFTSTFNDQDWILTYNGTTFTHNNVGDVTNIQYSPTVSKALVYDPFGNLKSVTTQPGGTVYAYLLDGKHQRVAKSTAGTVTARYMYENPYQIIGQVDNAGSVQKQYVFATNINSPDYMFTSTNRYRVIKDHLGSVRLVVKSSDGTLAQRIDYTDLGKVTADTSPGFQPYGFAGGIYESSTGLVRFGARDYDAETGRWLTKDPIRFAAKGTNLYGYVLNDPINFIDPNGLDQAQVDAARTWIENNYPSVAEGTQDWSIKDGWLPYDGGITLPGKNIRINTCDMSDEEVVNMVAHEMMHAQDGFWKTLAGQGRSHDAIYEESVRVSTQFRDGK